MTAVQDSSVKEMGPTSAHGTPTESVTPAFKFEVTDTAKLNLLVRVGAVDVR